MMTPRICTALGVALGLALVPVAAAAAPAAKKSAAARTSEPAPVRTYDFDPDDVDGESLRPEGSDVGSRPPGRHASMISVRSHFIPQLLKIAVDI